MITFQCDRCGEVLTTAEQNNKIVITIQDAFGVPMIRADLCNSCRVNLIHMLESFLIHWLQKTQEKRDHIAS
jgi:hypothetical protein